MTTFAEFCKEHDIIASAHGGGVEIDDDGWAHFAWRVTLRRGNRSMVTPYKCGLAHVRWKRGTPSSVRRDVRLTHKPRTIYEADSIEAWREPAPPEAAGVLQSLAFDALSSEQSFHSWCDDRDYSTDSRKALDLYLRCQDIARGLKDLLGYTLCRQLEALEDA